MGYNIQGAPPGYRSVGDLYQCRYVLVHDRHSPKADRDDDDPHEIVTRGDAQKIIDICVAQGIPFKQGYLGRDNGPPGQRWPIPGHVGFHTRLGVSAPVLHADTSYLSIGGKRRW